MHLSIFLVFHLFNLNVFFDGNTGPSCQNFVVYICAVTIKCYLSIYPNPAPLLLLLPPSSPGPGFAIFSVIQLLLPVMALWLQRSRGEHSYWDVAAANFKHAIGLSCELVVEHVNSFIHSGETQAGVFFPCGRRCKKNHPKPTQK